MTSSRLPDFYEIGLSNEEGLRYAIMQMLVASPHCMPNGYLPTATAIYEYIKANDLAAKRFDAASEGGGSYPNTPPVPMPSYTVAEAVARAQQAYREAHGGPLSPGVGTGTWSFGETHQVRQEDQFRPQEPSRD